MKIPLSEIIKVISPIIIAIIIIHENNKKNLKRELLSKKISVLNEYRNCITLCHQYLSNYWNLIWTVSLKKITVKEIDVLLEMKTLLDNQIRDTINSGNVAKDIYNYRLNIDLIERNIDIFIMEVIKALNIYKEDENHTTLRNTLQESYYIVNKCFNKELEVINYNWKLLLEEK